VPKDTSVHILGEKLMGGLGVFAARLGSTFVVVGGVKR
jgi:hypothetical protein